MKNTTKKYYATCSDGFSQTRKLHTFVTEDERDDFIEQTHEDYPSLKVLATNAHGYRLHDLDQIFTIKQAYICGKFKDAQTLENLVIYNRDIEIDLRRHYSRGLAK